MQDYKIVKKKTPKPLATNIGLQDSWTVVLNTTNIGLDDELDYFPQQSSWWSNIVCFFVCVFFFFYSELPIERYQKFKAQSCYDWAVINWFFILNMYFHKQT